MAVLTLAPTLRCPAISLSVSAAAAGAVGEEGCRWVGWRQEAGEVEGTSVVRREGGRCGREGGRGERESGMRRFRPLVPSSPEAHLYSHGNSLTSKEIPTALLSVPPLLRVPDSVGGEDSATPVSRASRIPSQQSAGSRWAAWRRVRSGEQLRSYRQQTTASPGPTTPRGSFLRALRSRKRC